MSDQLSDLVIDWTEVDREVLAEVAAGIPPRRYRVSAPFDVLDIRPGEMILLGGPPGKGKTAALMQIVVDMLAMNPDIQLLVANVEMVPKQLHRRILSRLSGVPLTTIRDNDRSCYDRLRAVSESYQGVYRRMLAMKGPFTGERLLATAKATGADVILVDYVQRFKGDPAQDSRLQLDGLLAALRELCSCGAAILAAAAVSRQSGQTGSDYENLGLASFRGSSELEFACDQAYVIGSIDADHLQFRCEKNREGDLLSIDTRFDRPIQTFTPASIGTSDDDIAEVIAKIRTGGKQ
ncbi:DnaB-like helicase C-terminal domain-containing protein [Mycobacterium sp.]|uniref:DnaB-like helicase C-terminal domain-containing protein n=1 Tax=Mycobacterium sp. TaxID=1785 RepID=UPI003A8477BB